MNRTTIRSVQRLDFRQHHADGTLTEFSVDHPSVDFAFVRVFTIGGVSAGGVRGGHAHLACTQMVACLAGRVDVEVDDGTNALRETLVPDGEALLIPPMLWNTETFEGPTALLRCSAMSSTTTATTCATGSNTSR